MIYGNQAFSISGDVGSDRFGAIFLPWTVLVQIPEIASNLFVLFSSLLPGRVRASAMSVFWDWDQILYLEVLDF